MRKLLLILCLPLIGIVLFIISGYVKYKGHFRSMTPVDTKQITENIWAIRTDFVNCFLIKESDSSYIAIDAGTDKAQLAAELDRLNINPDFVKKLFLTHTDYDHTAGATLFPNGETYLLEEEKVLIDGSTGRAPFMKNSLDVPFRTVKDQQIITHGNTTVKVIAAVGHTKGSACYLINDSYLFTGDILKISNGKGEIFIPDFNMDSEALKESLKRVAELRNISMIFTGHFGYSDNPEAVLEGVM